MICVTPRPRPRPRGEVAAQPSSTAAARRRRLARRRHGNARASGRDRDLHRHTGRGRHAAATAVRHAVRGVAHARLGKHELDLVRARNITGDRRHHRPDLLVTGEHQEGWCATVALDTNRVEARFGMRELAVPMRRTEPQLCTLGSISGPSASVDSSQGSSRRRSSRVTSRSGRWPVAQTISRRRGSLQRNHRRAHPRPSACRRRRDAGW